MGALDAARALLHEALGGVEQEIVSPAGPAAGRERLVLFSDLHAPWTRMDIFAKILRVPADRALIIGDVDDGYEASRYPKHEHVSTIESWAVSKALLEQAARTWANVDVVEGNHDTRLEKAIRNAFETQPGMVDAIRLLAGGSLSPLKALTSGMPNVRICGTKVGRFDVDWFYQYGDLLVVHAEKFSSTPAAAVRAVADWFRRMHKQLGLKPWRVLVQAHTHQISMLPYDDDKLLLECGCVSDLHGYQLVPKIGGLPQRLGYIALDMDHGKVSIPSVRPVWLD